MNRALLALLTLPRPVQAVAALSVRAAWLVLAGLLALLPWLGTPSWAQPVKTEHVTAELVAREAGVAPGGQISIGLRLQHAPHWHTYWRNPGDSGLATSLSWKLPAGAQVGEIEWPAPQRLPFGPLMNFGYEGDLLLPMRLTAPADAAPGQTLQLEAEANWLVCREVCVPESAQLKQSVPVLAPGTAAPPGPLAARFDQAARERPAPLAGWRAEWQRAGRELQFRLIRESGTAVQPTDLPAIHVFPYTEQLLESAQHQAYAHGGGYLVEMRLDPNAQVPSRVPGIVVALGSDAPPWAGGSRSAEFDAPVREVAALQRPADARLLASPQPQAAGAKAKPGAAPDATQGSTWLAWLAAMGLAFAGGMLLNLMPCVFPVLSIKLLGLTKQDQAPAALRSHAVAYTAGVVLTFLGLAALLLVLRAGGQAVGWGFQLQSPAMVYALALLFAALGLNLMGLFEFGLMLPQGAAGWTPRHPMAQAFGSGVLAVLAASPCTAPFMGAALGAALTQPAPMALAVFAALGLGMAVPYAALVLLPGWRQRLPRPGAWMQRLKQALAFPMFATVVWLLWVLGQQTDIDALARALIGLLGLALGLWWWGVLQAAPAGGVVGKSAAAAVALAILAWSWPRPADEAASASAAATAPAGAAASSAGAPPKATMSWQPYSDRALQAELAQGRTVFVEFTAAWCVSCQVNKRLVLDRPDVLQAFQRAGVVLMRADWTRRDAEISAALNRLGRNGVPVYLLQRPDREAVLLPEILTAQMVLDALAGH